MKPFTLLLAAALLSSCAMAPPRRATSAADGPLPPPPPPPPPPAATPPAPPASGGIGLAGHASPPCPLTVSFASYGAGIDAPARGRVEALLASDRGVTGFQANQWGREGEVTFCVRTRAPADAARLYQAIRLVVPPNPRGPISLHTLDGLGFDTPAAR
jgi:hypothetical protein